MENRRYLIVTQRAKNYSSAACPLDGQIGVNNILIAYTIYYYLMYYAYTHYDSIAVMLFKKNSKGTYDVIKR